MTTTELTLTPSETAALAALSRREGKTPEAILHEALEQFLANHEASRPDSESRLAALRQGRGIWEQRDDLPDFAELRSEWNRF